MFTNEGTGAVSIVGSLPNKVVTEIITFNALAIADTSAHGFGPFDISLLSGRKYLHIYNSLGQSVTISLMASLSGGTNWATMGSKIIPSNSGGGQIISIADIPGLADPISKLYLNVSCTIAPVTGILSIWLEGVSA